MGWLQRAGHRGSQAEKVARQAADTDKPVIACSARTVVTGAGRAFSGLKWVIAFYLLTSSAGVGRLISSFVPGTPFGLLMDIPPYRIPPFRSVAAKVWFRTRSFLLSAWPALIVASVLMALLEFAGIDGMINSFLQPFTVTVLGLPAAVGVTLVFGIFRKELTC